MSHISDAARTCASHVLRIVLSWDGTTPGNRIDALAAPIQALLDSETAALREQNQQLYDQVQLAYATKISPDQLAAKDAEIARLQQVIESDRAAQMPCCPRCAQCGKPATCLGSYEHDFEDGREEYACDDCCGHGNEDGYCEPIKPNEPCAQTEEQK